MKEVPCQDWKIDDPLQIADKGFSVVYLIHFDSPYKHARHYLGTTKDLTHRLTQHSKGTKFGGARLMEVIINAGISWQVSRLWIGGIALERQLKRWGNHGRICPICKAERKNSTCMK